ncbi:MAG: elongation factor Ts [Planctomycetes bacterium]|nr:elongation factor Ts [Planctomycetota bacterium]
MTEIDAKTVMRLREMTGAPMMDCKAALKEVAGDMDKAKEVLRKKGKQIADKAASREVKEGKLFSYVHFNGRIAVLVEIVCETDFVAKNEEFNAFGKGVCFTVAASSPPVQFLGRQQVDPALVEKEREIVQAQTLQTMKGKPQTVIDKAIEGRMEKYFAEKCLMETAYVDPTGHGEARSVEQKRTELVGKIGENIQVRRFVRWELGS